MSEPRPTGRIETRSLTLGYDGTDVVHALDLGIAPGRITSIVGSNACGKSTLLRGLARLLKPRGGTVLLDGEAIGSLRTKEVARRLGLLPQGPVAPEGLTVEGLVARGRYPHQTLASRWSREDEERVEWALGRTGTLALRDRMVDELSGGQRQRAWLALALAQDTQTLLLDEPTTYLDLAHQVEVLDLLEDLNREEGRTIVLVLHDLNQACRYSHEIVALVDGRVARRGEPSAVVDAEMVRRVFGLDAEVIPHPLDGTPLCLPLGRNGGRRQAAA